MFVTQKGISACNNKKISYTFSKAISFFIAYSKLYSNQKQNPEDLIVNT